jgi:hypothetical protein
VALPQAVAGLMAAQDAVKDSKAEPRPAPLREFMEALLGEPSVTPQGGGGSPGVVREMVRACWDEVAAALKLPGPNPGARDDSAGAGAPVAAPAAELYSIVVELEDGVADKSGKPAWKRRARLYRHRTKSWARADRDLPDATETPETIGKYLKAVRSWVRGRINRSDAIIFELFVERTLLTRAFDEWDFPLDKFTGRLGFVSPVVMRVIDRDPDLRPDLERRWDKLETARRLDPDQHVVTRTAGGDVSAIYEDFARNPDLLCLVIDPSLGPQDDVTKFPCLDAAIAAGLPVIIWSRHAKVDPALREKLRDWAEQAPRSLPELVYDLRRNCPRDVAVPLARNLAIVFEGAHWPPARNEEQATEAR